MIIRAIAWDIDGTLVDSEPLHHEALLASGRRWGADFSDLTIDAFRGVHLPDVWTALRPRLPADVTPAAWMNAVEDHYAAHAHGLQPLPGVLDTVGRIAALGLPQICVSNSSRRVVDANLAALGIGASILFSISLNDVERGKPDPEPYRRGVQRLGLAPAAVLAVEDSATGARSARAAGLAVAGYGPAGLAVDGAGFFVDRIERVLDLIGRPAVAALPG
jgi:HAD superfamily hydrolase (TIGR01509 family)